ncbi:MAG: tRNA (guanosine(37)-N1)-methyltransferase TrmD [Firmicutes bacterium]|nr:tRNA (guanosine(37)-N1)-methyltransferase TrmD [Bacillota bacterium]
MKINVLTLFPEMFTAVTETSILGKAGEKGLLDVNLINIRDFSKDKHHKADDTPFGGGPGMVMTAQPIFDALKSIDAQNKKAIYMSPRGSVLNQQKIEELVESDELIILCGHYEGVDQRVLDHFNMEEISIGDYILTGGELPAMVLIDSVARFIPEVLGNHQSTSDESIYSGLLECNQYTKPRNYEGLDVPEVLTNGNHKLIHLWQYENALELTKERRPDLWQSYIEKDKDLTKDEKKILDKVLCK